MNNKCSDHIIVLRTADFLELIFFKKYILGTLSDCQMLWIHLIFPKYPINEIIWSHPDQIISFLNDI